MRRRPARTVLGDLIAATLVGCGGSSGSSDAAAPAAGDTTAPAGDSGPDADSG